MDVFNFTDYKDFIRAVLVESKHQRGFKSELAAAAGCQRAYISQVFNSHVHLTPEHACNIAQFLGMDEWETDYFLVLVDLGRAGSQRLQQRLRVKLESIKRQAVDFSRRLKTPSLNTPEAQALYYSSWHWGAIHMLISSPEYQLPATISARLGLPIETTLETLRGLKTMGLASHDGERWRFVGGNLHLPKDSPLNGVNHQNWRTRAVLDVQNPGSDGIHYSLAFTVDRGDIAKLRAALLALIDQQRQLITRSGSEELMCFTCDLFTL